MYYGLSPFQTNFYVKYCRCCKGLLSQNPAFIFIWERTPASKQNPITMRGCCGRGRGRGRWIYNYLCNQCPSPLTLRVEITLRRDLLDTTLCDKVCQWLANSRWFSPGTTVSGSFTNKTERPHLTEIFFESCVKHHTPSNYNYLYFMLHLLWLVWSCKLHDLYLGYIKLLFRSSSMYCKMYGPGGRTYVKKIFYRKQKSRFNYNKNRGQVV